MPELPEVETVRRGLEQQTLGWPIGHVEVLRSRAIASPPAPEIFCWALRGSQLAGWSRRGKYLLGALTGRDGTPAGQLGVHLRMTGQFLWLNAATPICRHTRVRFHREGGGELRFVDVRSFGQMWWVPPDTEAAEVITGLQRLGPEPFCPSFTAAYLQSRLAGSQRPIKNALLDQALVAGVGNIYADEALFLAGIHPQIPSAELPPPKLKELRRALLSVLESSIGAGGTTFSDFRDLSGTNGNYGGEAWVYRRAGLSCRRCGTTIQRERLAGRSSHWCPTCQGR